MHIVEIQTVTRFLQEDTRENLHPHFTEDQSFNTQSSHADTLLELLLCVVVLTTSQ